MGEALNGILRVRRNGVAGAVLLRCAVLIQLFQPDSEQLHYFSCVIFIGSYSAAGVGLVVVYHVEIVAHDRAQGDVGQ